MIFGPIVVLVLRPSGPTNVSDYSWGSVKIYDVLSWLVFSWWEMCSCSSVQSYNAVLGRCPMVVVLDRSWMFCCEATMVQISLDAVLLSFFGFPALPSADAKEHTPRSDVITFHQLAFERSKYNVPLHTPAHSRVRNLQFGAKS